MRKVTYWMPLCLGLVFFLSGCSRQIETGLSEQGAHEIVITLRENGIDAVAEMEPSEKKDMSTWQVIVRGGNDKTIEAWKILRENGLPREKVTGLNDVFANSGLIPTAAEEKARLLSGLAGELTRTLESLPGVVEAHVQVVIPDNSPLLEKSQQTPTTASVLVQYRDNQPPLKEGEIQKLVAKGVEGLAPDQVAVVLKKVEVKPIPRRVYGPLPADNWFLFAALSLAAIAGIGSLSLLFISKSRSLRIKKLEQQLAGSSAAKLPAAAN